MSPVRCVFLGVVGAAVIVAAGAQQDPQPTQSAKSAAAAIARRSVTMHGAVFARQVRLAELSKASVLQLGPDFSSLDMRMKAPELAQIVSVETGDSKVMMTAERRYGNDALVTVPIKGNEVTVEAKMSAGRAFWTGVGIGGRQAPQNMAFSLGDSPGCQISIDTDPPGVTVSFNDNEWQYPTSTTSVRDPGTWTVKLSLKGYQDWTATQELGPRETWRITAVYPTTKKHKTKKQP